MPNTICIGLQDFEKLRRLNAFYIDKTRFLSDWWQAKDDVTLITRPRRFGKTLTMSMVEQFFSVEHTDHALFDDLEIWKNEEMRSIQGTYPVIFLSFSDIKENSFIQARNKICESIVDLYNHFDYLAQGNLLNPREKGFFIMSLRKWRILKPQSPCAVCLDTCINIIAKGSSSFWMNTILLCLRRIPGATGKS